MTHRLLQLRHLDGLTVEKAAEQFGVPSSTYSAIERGTRPFTLDAHLVGYSPDRLLSLPSMSEPLHRQRASVGETRIRSNREQLRLAGELMIELRHRGPKVPMISVARMGVPTSMRHVEEMAAEARYMLGLSQDDPIGNLTSAVERAGVCLTPIHDPVRARGTAKGKHVDGLSAWVEEQPTIGVNPDTSGDRFRLTLAHELGHLLMHLRPSETAETEAFIFASALLVPTEPFIDMIGDRPTMKSFVAMKRVWGMSIAAGIYRAHELDIVDDDRYRSLQIQMAKWRHDEPGSFEIRPGRLLARLVEESGGVRALATDLGIQERHVQRTINWDRPRLTAIQGGGDNSPVTPARQRSLRAL